MRTSSQLQPEPIAAGRRISAAVGGASINGTLIGAVSSHAVGGPSALARSRRFCEQLTRTQARNFYYGLKLLPEPKRAAMFALYAYMRMVDDIADDGRSPEQRDEDLELWANRRTRSSPGVHNMSCLCWPPDLARLRGHGASATTCQCAFSTMLSPDNGRICGRSPSRNFDQLYEYCYRVAGTVGLASIYVWGFEGGEETELLAVERGVAFQMTNILRDLREDAERGRTYLPSDDLAAHDVTPDDLAPAVPEAIRRSHAPSDSSGRDLLPAVVRLGEPRASRCPADARGDDGNLSAHPPQDRRRSRPRPARTSLPVTIVEDANWLACITGTVNRLRYGNSTAKPPGSRQMAVKK